MALQSFVFFVALLLTSACGMNNFANQQTLPQSVCASADCETRPADPEVTKEETPIAGTVDTTFGKDGYLLLPTGNAIGIARVKETYAVASQYPSLYLGKLPITASRLDTFSSVGVAGASANLSSPNPSPLGALAVAAFEGGSSFHAFGGHALEGTLLLSLDETPKSIGAESLNESGYRIFPRDSARNGELIAIAGSGLTESKDSLPQPFLGFALETEGALKPLRYAALASEAGEATAVSAYRNGFLVGFQSSGKSDIVLAHYDLNGDVASDWSPVRIASVVVPLELDARVEGVASHESRSVAVVSLPDSQKFYVVLLDGMTVVARIPFEHPDREKILPQDISFSEDGKMIYVGGHLKDTKRGFLLKLKAADGAITSGFGWRTVPGYVNHLLVEKDRVLFAGQLPSATPTIFSQGRAMVGALHR